MVIIIFDKIQCFITVIKTRAVTISKARTNGFFC